MTYAAATCWALARSEVLRGDLVHLEAVEALLEAACWAFHIPYDMQAHLVIPKPQCPSVCQAPLTNLSGQLRLCERTRLRGG